MSESKWILLSDATRDVGVNEWIERDVVGRVESCGVSGVIIERACDQVKPEHC